MRSILIPCLALISVNLVLVGSYAFVSAQDQTHHDITTKVNRYWNGLKSLVKNKAREDFGNYYIDRRDGVKKYEQVDWKIRALLKLIFGNPLSGELVVAPGVQDMLAKATHYEGDYNDSPQSRKDIGKFIKQYKLNVTELLEPDPTSYNTFNEFFYRKLRLDARPIESPEDPKVLVSPADSRLMVFVDVDEATKFWIKKKDFTLSGLLHGQHTASHFVNGTILIARLAPQDYHRFHVPCDAKVGPSSDFNGTYYTVNPMAVHRLPVFTENRRVVTLMHSDTFGAIAYVSVGAVMVASVILTGAAKEDVQLTKGDEVGYFAFGGSTVVIVFENGSVKWDDDLLTNSRNGIETLVRMGERIGTSARA